ncbi:MAG: 7-cyano-7-deazaguanine synthase QueC [Candidatus Neomarinimicrobiota bacterium]|nr:7-cyano-7-deazaguanine synthase QueC [Candidatus Neomarinimicrobiota bacterium]|tara:strand:- start:134 stop:808 length:675 start_codon:yes stop_codon:yes gene_type:complete
MKKKIQKSVVLVSGGMDSCVTATIAEKESNQMAFLHVNYGQRTERRELKAFEDIANFYDVKERFVLDYTHLAKIGGSSLTDLSIEVPKANLENSEIPNSYVPFRNANILSAAVSWAEVINADTIYIGAVEEDSSGYPDCRRSFYDAFEKTIDEGTKPQTKIKIKTPLIEMSKRDIVSYAFINNSPIQFSWSCYRNEDIPCGECDSCKLRERGFKLAGYIDPIIN